VSSLAHALHLEDLRISYDRLTEYGLIISAKKCIFASNQVIFFGHAIDSTGIFLVVDEPYIIRNFSYSATVVQIKHCRFSHVHVDIFGTLPKPNSRSYLVMCDDRFIRWHKAIPIYTGTLTRAFTNRLISIFDKFYPV
ncbi:hypothetical protein X801_01386, partial [Opisthorchis viverrini]